MAASPYLIDDKASNASQLSSLPRFAAIDFALHAGEGVSAVWTCERSLLLHRAKLTQNKKMMKKGNVDAFCEGGMHVYRKNAENIGGGK